jgi:hypothetical protein
MRLYYGYEVATDGSDHRHADPDRAKVEASLDQTLTELGDGVDRYALGTVEAGSAEEALARIRAGAWEYTRKVCRHP